MLKLSVITPVSRHSSILKEYLDSFHQLPQDTLEIILVGNVESINVPASLNIKLIPEKNPSQSLRRNIGVTYASADILCFLDDDVQVNKLWFETLIDWFSKHPRDILGGPNFDQRKGFRIQLTSAIEGSFLTEGLISHKRHPQLFSEVGIHDLHLCNMTCKRDVFNHIGKFNEKISVYLDDVEFNYIARKLGYRLIFHRDMQIQHRIRPLWLPYFIYKGKTRYEIGKIIPLYYCLYQDAFQLKLIFASYIVLPLMLIFLPGHLWLTLLSLYFFLAFALSFRHIKSIAIFLLLPFHLLLVNTIIYLGFTCGLMHGFLTYRQLRKLIQQKNDRFQKFQKE